MLQRYYSHFTFISGIGFFKNYIVELKDGYLLTYFAFDRELPVTEFQSGLIIYIPCDKVFVEEDFLMKNPIMDGLIREKNYLVRSFRV